MRPKTRKNTSRNVEKQSFKKSKIFQNVGWRVRNNYELKAAQI